MSTIEERSNWLGNISDSQASNPVASLSLNVNSKGDKLSPQVGDTLLFVKSFSNSDRQQAYIAVGFPNFSLERRALIDI